MKTRVHTSLEAKNILTELESKTRLTPNIICRYGIILYLKSNSTLNFNYDSNGQEFHRPILTGEYDVVFKELIKQQEDKYISDDDYLVKYLKAHLDRKSVV